MTDARAIVIVTSGVLFSRYNVASCLWAVVSDKFLGLVFMTGFSYTHMLTKYQFAVMFLEWNLMFWFVFFWLWTQNLLSSEARSKEKLWEYGEGS